jgi:hypothetical protein
MKRAARLLAAAISALACAAAAQTYPQPPPDQAAQYAADAPKTILDLQPFRRAQKLMINGPAGRSGTATLVDLNPYANAWFLLTLELGDKVSSYHLQNSEPKRQHLQLEDHGLVLTIDGQDFACELWSSEPTPLAHAATSRLPYAPLCGGRLYLRNRVAGRRTDLERVTDFLRDHVWGGEAIVGFVREELYADAFLERGRAEAAVDGGPEPAGAPRRAAVGPAYAERAVTPPHLEITVAGPPSGRLTLGRWYPASGLPGIWLGVIEPQAVSPDILASYPSRASPLDAVEAGALDYLVAFDLSAFDLRFALGTDHPRLGWSPRPPDEVRNGALPGPDGIDTAAPLVTTGMVSPDLLKRTVATFTGGFKRAHGAFKYGELAYRNHGSHYGFIEEGVVFSKLQPGLATLLIKDDGAIDMRTWSADDDRSLAGIRYARQNGVPLVQPDPATGAPEPGALVTRWGAGNWSGSAKGKFRTLRAGACLQETAGRRFLIYGYFSTATPSAMARVFQAYHCRYAMQLDINALEHTYLALYRRQGDKVAVEHLIRGMDEVDKDADGELVPRFIGFPDNRDFFYLVRREEHP